MIYLWIGINFIYQVIDLLFIINITFQMID
jgi:hypothetical protein